MRYFLFVMSYMSNVCTYWRRHCQSGSTLSLNYSQFV